MRACVRELVCTVFKSAVDLNPAVLDLGSQIVHLWACGQGSAENGAIIVQAYPEWSQTIAIEYLDQRQRPPFALLDDKAAAIPETPQPFTRGGEVRRSRRAAQQMRWTLVHTEVWWFHPL